MPKAIKYLLSMKRLPILIVMLAAGIFLAFQTLGKTVNNNPPSKYEKILQIVGEILTQGHYSPKDINDDFSRKVYNKYFEELDPEKDIFLKEDMTTLQPYSTKIDDEIKGQLLLSFSWKLESFSIKELLKQQLFTKTFCPSLLILQQMKQ